MSGLVRAAVQGIGVVLVLVAMARFVVDRDALDHDTVFRGDDDIALTGSDGWFHARHALHAAQAWPQLVRFDPGAQFPRGLRTTHVGLWDLALGTAIRVAGATDDPVAARRVLARVAPTVGAIAVAVVAVVAFAALRRRRGVVGVDAVGGDGGDVGDVVVAVAGAVVAAWLLVLTPAHYGTVARLGDADHHVVEPVLGWLSVLGLAVATTPVARTWSRVCLVLVGALPLLAYLFTWVGGPLILGLLGTGVLLAAALDVVRSPADVVAHEERRGVLGWGASLLGVQVVIVSVWPLAVMEPLLGTGTTGTLVGLVVGLGLLHGLAQQPGWRSSSPAARTGVAVMVAGVVVAGVLAWPTTRGLLTMLFAARADTVAEHREVILVDVWARHGFAAGLALLALLWGLWRLWSGARVSAAVGAGTALVVGMVGLWVQVHDYGTQVAPLLAAAGGIGAGLVLDGLPRRPARGAPGAARPGRIAAVAVVVVLALSATVTTWSGRPAVTLMPASAGRRLLLTPAWRDALGWLRQAPPTASWDITREFPTGPDMDLAGTPGVLAAWDHGHLVAAVAGRPTVADHGPSPEAAKVWTAPDEATALAALCPACGPGEAVRFIIADVDGAHLGLHPNLALAGAAVEPHLRRARVPIDGVSVEVSTVGGGTTTFGAQLWATPLAPFAHVRAVWQSTSESLATHQVVMVDGRPVTTPRIVPVTEANRASLSRLAAWTPSQPRAVRAGDGLLLGGLLSADLTIFEVVRGATVEVQVPGRAGRAMTLTLPLQTPRGPAWWTVGATLDDAGRARVVVPRATPTSPPDPRRGNVLAIGPYTVAIDTVVVGALVVTDADVEEGRVVAATFGGPATGREPSASGAQQRRDGGPDGP